MTRLDGLDDIVNKLNELMKCWDQKPPFEKVNVTKNYIASDVNLCIAFKVNASCVSDTQNRYTVIQSTTRFSTNNKVSAVCYESRVSYVCVTADGSYWYQVDVLVKVAESPKCPKYIVPSLVWLQCINSTDVSRREFLYFSLSTHAIKFLSIPGKREKDALVISPISTGKFDGHLVERGPQVIDQFSRNQWRTVWKWIGKLDFQRAIASRWIDITEHGVSITSECFLNNKGNVTGLLTGTFYLEFRA